MQLLPVHFKRHLPLRFACFTSFPYFQLAREMENSFSGIQWACVGFRVSLNFGNSIHLSQFQTAFLFSVAMLCKTVDCRVNDVVIILCTLTQSRSDNTDQSFLTWMLYNNINIVLKKFLFILQLGTCSGILQMRYR